MNGHLRTSAPPHFRTPFSKSVRKCGGAEVAFALLIAVLVSACDSLPGKPTPEEKPLRPAEVTDFATLYGANCAGCHGSDGKLGGARPFDDAVYLALIGETRLAQVTARGVANSAMPGFAPAAGGMLTDAQIDLLAKGIMAKWGKANALAGATAPAYESSGGGDAQRGAAAFATHCAACHGADGSGTKQGGSVVDGAYLGLVSDQALRSAVLAGRIDLGMPDWRGAPGGTPMTDQQVTDVVAWLVSKRPQFPGQPYGGK